MATELNTTATTTSPAPAGLARRAFLSTAASAGAAAALAPAAALAAATSAPDPIFALIAKHRAACGAVELLCDEQSALERALPMEKRSSYFHFHEEMISDTDDPAWVENQRQIMNGHNTVDDIACELVSFTRISRAGLKALIDYSIEFEDRNQWPESVVMDDGSELSWHQAFLVAVAAALQNGEVAA